ncbi:alpha/beta hydrolase [Dermatobacter hominis]|uniref:alpha/beta hydrolase n=1 Tax=Dermatobacter hominis TaxID=2884263 RepID=UPI001D12741B|nr:alpha/beta hydrolase [Dermatobacter hominis]UDY34132.1 alpha/beta hydrolase [Dermatobacter hominis]
MTRTRLPALLVACAVLFTACSDGGSPSAEKESDPRPTGGAPAAGGTDGDLHWSKCTGKLTAMAGLDCATLDVPLDPAEPDGDRVGIALARKAATGPADERIGSLVINPGGPGGSGLEFLANAASSFPSSLTDRFDLVSFDPRGVGESDPVRCLDDDQKDAQMEGDLTPDTPEERTRIEEDQTALREGCTERNPEMVTHMSTADVAADLDRIRTALGDEQLNFLGYSYGTSIGATYAAMFPTHIRAMVLDGSISPSASAADQAMVQATGFERTLANFIAACDADQTCALAPDAAAAIAATRAELESKPVTVEDSSGSRTLNRDLFDYGLATALYDTSTWGPTAQAIADIREGGAATFLALVDRQTGRQADGSYDNSSDAQVMVNCADQEDRPTAEQAAQDEARIAQAAPTFGALIGAGLTGCDDWPEPAQPTPAPKADGAPSILVIGTVGDPATPYEWAQEMTQALSGSVLLTYEGDGHTAFLRGGQCIEDAVVGYFVDLEVPSAGTRCPAQSSSDEFGGVRDELIEQLADSGLPQELATCVVDGMIERVGEAEFNDMVLKNEQEEITKLAQATALECATSGGG